VCGDHAVRHAVRTLRHGVSALRAGGGRDSRVRSAGRGLDCRVAARPSATGIRTYRGHPVCGRGDGAALGSRVRLHLTGGARLEPVRRAVGGRFAAERAGRARTERADAGGRARRAAGGRCVLGDARGAGVCVRAGAVRGDSCDSRTDRDGGRPRHRRRAMGVVASTSPGRCSRGGSGGSRRCAVSPAPVSLAGRAADRGARRRAGRCHPDIGRRTRLPGRHRAERPGAAHGTCPVSREARRRRRGDASARRTLRRPDGGRGGDARPGGLPAERSALTALRRCGCSAPSRWRRRRARAGRGRHAAGGHRDARRRVATAAGRRRGKERGERRDRRSAGRQERAADRRRRGAGRAGGGGRGIRRPRRRLEGGASRQRHLGESRAAWSALTALRNHQRRGWQPIRASEGRRPGDSARCRSADVSHRLGRRHHDPARRRCARGADRTPSGIVRGGRSSDTERVAWRTAQAV
jgi:hypothetical protein